MLSLLGIVCCVFMWGALLVAAGFAAWELHQHHQFQEQMTLPLPQIVQVHAVADHWPNQGRWADGVDVSHKGILVFEATTGHIWQHQGKSRWVKMPTTKWPPGTLVHARGGLRNQHRCWTLLSDTTWVPQWQQWAGVKEFHAGMLESQGDGSLGITF